MTHSTDARTLTICCLFLGFGVGFGGVATAQHLPVGVEFEVQDSGTSVAVSAGEYEIEQDGSATEVRSDAVAYERDPEGSTMLDVQGSLVDVEYSADGTITIEFEGGEIEDGPGAHLDVEARDGVLDYENDGAGTVALSYDGRPVDPDPSGFEIVTPDDVTFAQWPDA
jgi:hypothetical protein